MNGGLVVRSGFSCKCGKTTCDGCINRENHLRSRNKEQRLIDEAIAEKSTEKLGAPVKKDQLSVSAEAILKTEQELPTKELVAAKPKRTRKSKKSSA